jgi:hypothetical protein
LQISDPISLVSQFRVKLLGVMIGDFALAYVYEQICLKLLKH